MTKLLPDTGVISVQELADYYEVVPTAMLKALRDNGIPILRTGKKYSQRLVSMRAISKFLDIDGGA